MRNGDCNWTGMPSAHLTIKLRLWAKFQFYKLWAKFQFYNLTERSFWGKLVSLGWIMRALNMRPTKIKTISQETLFLEMQTSIHKCYLKIFRSSGLSCSFWDSILLICTWASLYWTGQLLLYAASQLWFKVYFTWIIIRTGSYLHRLR